MKRLIAQLFSSDNGLLMVIGLVVTIFHLCANAQYGFHRDELDILMNARQLAWGYVAYPPLTPFIARLGLEVFGISLIGLRSFAAIAQGVVVVLTGLMARDLGGKRLAQIVAALAMGISPVALTAGTLIQYMSFDFLWWVLLAFFLVRLLATDNPRWWLGIGAAIGLGMLTKFTIAFFIAGLAVGILLTSARRYLLSPWLWAGAGAALLIYSPNLLWQIQHNFVSLDFLSAIHARDIEWGRAESYLTDQLTATTNPFTLPVWIAGLASLLFAASLKRFRALAWMFLTTFALLLATRGRGYYLAPAYAMLLAAGAVWLQRWLETLAAPWKKVAHGVTWAMLAVGGVMGAALIKPTAPINSALWDVATKLSDNFVEMVGWPDMAEQVAAIYAGLPENEKPRTAILAGNYGEAGALDLYGAEYGLPPVISGANSLWERGYGNPAPETLIVVGFDRGYAGQFFQACQFAGTVKNRYGVKNEETSRHTGLYVCRDPRQPWADMWPDMQWFQ